MYMDIDTSDPIGYICPSGRGAGDRKRDSHNSGDIILDRNVDLARARHPRMDPILPRAISDISTPVRGSNLRHALRSSLAILREATLRFIRGKKK